MNNGITALTLTDLSTQTPKQSTNTNITSDPTITDPGDDPFGPPIPVGDGWGLLTFLGFCYAAFKMRSLLFRKLQFLLSKRK